MLNPPGAALLPYAAQPPGNIRAAGFMAGPLVRQVSQLMPQMHWYTAADDIDSFPVMCYNIHVDIVLSLYGCGWIQQAQRAPTSGLFFIIPQTGLSVNNVLQQFSVYRKGCWAIRQGRRPGRGPADALSGTPLPPLDLAENVTVRTAHR